MKMQDQAAQIMSKTPLPKVSVVDDDPDLLTFFKALADLGRFKLLGAYKNAREALANLPQRPPDVVFQIITCIFEGKADKDIASSLGIGFATVRTHMNHLFEKLGVHSREELIAGSSNPEPHPCGPDTVNNQSPLSLTMYYKQAFACTRTTHETFAGFCVCLTRAVSGEC